MIFIVKEGVGEVITDKANMHGDGWQNTKPDVSMNSHTQIAAFQQGQDSIKTYI